MVRIRRVRNSAFGVSANTSLINGSTGPIVAPDMTVRVLVSSMITFFAIARRNYKYCWRLMKKKYSNCSSEKKKFRMIRRSDIVYMNIDTINILCCYI